MAFKHKHLLGIQALTPSEITKVLDTAESFYEISTREVKKIPTLRGKTIINLFFEPSTRTRSSFELAAKRLSADMADSAKSVILKQVENGIAVRMAVLYLLLGGKKREAFA